MKSCLKKGEGVRERGSRLTEEPTVKQCPWTTISPREEPEVKAQRKEKLLQHWEGRDTPACSAEWRNLFQMLLWVGNNFAYTLRLPGIGQDRMGKRVAMVVSHAHSRAGLWFSTMSEGVTLGCFSEESPCASILNGTQWCFQMSSLWLYHLDLTESLLWALQLFHGSDIEWHWVRGTWK